MSFLTITGVTALIWQSVVLPTASMQEIESEQITETVNDEETKKRKEESLAPQSAQSDINGPAGSGAFGTHVAALPNGNIVVTDPSYDITSPSVIANVGAAYLYNGTTGEMISMLTGSAANDQVGSHGVTVLPNGNYLILSQNWNNGAGLRAGAVTFGNGLTGISGTVSAGNSLVGSTANDNVGSSGIFILTNNNYVVTSSFWSNGTFSQAEAVTFGNGTSGINGVVSSANSLIGSSTGDMIGRGGVTALTNGNYVVRSQNWNSGAVFGVGAVTFGNGSTGISGSVSSTNSLVGSTASDSVGNGGITALPNGNYVVRNQNWANGAATMAGAVTFCNGTNGRTGTVSAANSLVGSRASDQIGDRVTVLTNSNYVISSWNWDNGAATEAGAVTFGSGTTGVSGAISSTNSLIGSRTSDQVGIYGITTLTNGNYVVSSPFWDNGAVIEAGAVTFGSGTTGRVGTISSANSLVGSVTNSRVGDGEVVALTNGNYVVSSPLWDNGATSDVGAATFGNGTTGISGAVSSANSLVGTMAFDKVGGGTSNGVGITALANGNYVVRSPNWNNGAVTSVGAVTFGNGTTGTSGPVTTANSLVGPSSFDRIGSDGITPLTNGNYLVRSSGWQNAGQVSAGAVTLANGATGTNGTVSAANSLVGSKGNDLVGAYPVIALSNGNYVVQSDRWDNGTIVDAGAVTFGSGTTGISGPIAATNSLVGSTANDNLGSAGVFALSNGNYVVCTGNWDNGPAANAGAVTFGNGTTGTSGAISAANSLIGSAANDTVGNAGFTPLPNGNWTLYSQTWDDGLTINAGAVTYGAGNGATVGVINVQNSVVGSIANSGGLMVNSLDTFNETLVVGKRAENKVTIFNPTYTAVASGNWSAAATWDYGAFTKKHDVVIPSTRNVTLNANIVANSVLSNGTGR